MRDVRAAPSEAATLMTDADGPSRDPAAGLGYADATMRGLLLLSGRGEGL